MLQFLLVCMRVALAAAEAALVLECQKHIAATVLGDQGVLPRLLQVLLRPAG
jgi:hypothetical protein